MNFFRTFSPIAITALIALIAIILSLGMTDRALKRSAAIHSLHLVEQYFENKRDFQETLLLDYTEWNDTVSNLAIKHDLEWFHLNIELSEMLNTTVHGVAYIQNNGTLFHQVTRDNNPDYKILPKSFQSEFYSVKDRILKDTSYRPTALSFFKNINGLPAMVTFSAITNQILEEFPEMTMDQRDFLVFWTLLTPENMAHISQNLNLEDLSITHTVSPDYFAMKNSKDDIIATLKWSPFNEDYAPLTLSLYTSIAMFCLVLVGVYFSYKRIVDLMSQLNQSRLQAENGHKIKSDFLATMSHELRTPLNSIIGFSDILALDTKEILNERQYEYIGHIQSSGKHLLTIINEILDMSKIEAGKYDLFEEEMNLKNTINQSIIYLAKEAEDKNIAIIKQIPDIMNEFMGDQKVIRQLMLNLLSNSIKFTPPNGTVTVGCRVTGIGTMEIFVADTGIGISPEKLDLITEPYLQDQDHKTRSHQGTGLGLAISKAFVEMHQGSLTIKSALNVGTTVTITFPEARVLPEMI